MKNCMYVKHVINILIKMKFQVSQSEKKKTTLDPISDDTKDLLN